MNVSTIRVITARVQRGDKSSTRPGGGGGGLANFDGAEGVKKRETTFQEYRMKVAGKKKLQQILATGARYVAAPCANCKRQITQLMEYYEIGVQVGGETKRLEIIRGES
jgi:Fe-S oxidoreductase